MICADLGFGKLWILGMPCAIHRVEQYRSAVQGVEAMTLVSNHHFPRHSHDQFALGRIAFGGQRSWSAVGHVEAVVGDLIMANPGELHDGVPLDGKVRGWQMIYLDPALVSHELEQEITAPIELVRPVARDRLLAQSFAQLFAFITSPSSDRLAQEESLIRTLVCLVRRHSTTRAWHNRFSPSVAKAIQRLDAAPSIPVSLAELAALSGVSRFQLLRAFAREVGTTPHAYLVQRRVTLARRLLAVGKTPAQAALDAGFADQSHLTRAFVRYIGVTPARYRSAVA
jgi:AraC-like DNA-binding protein